MSKCCLHNFSLPFSLDNIRLNMTEHHTLFDTETSTERKKTNLINFNNELYTQTLLLLHGELFPPSFFTVEQRGPGVP